MAENISIETDDYGNTVVDMTIQYDGHRREVVGLFMAGTDLCEVRVYIRFPSRLNGRDGVSHGKLLPMPEAGEDLVAFTESHATEVAREMDRTPIIDAVPPLEA